MATSSHPLPLRRKLAYAALLTATALAVLLGTLELALRLAGYGHSPHFTRREKLPDGSVIIRENRDCTAPYFSEKLVRRPQPFRLPEKKAPGTIRVFVLGSSAAMGDPEASFSLARMLELQLRAAYPEKHFEVINAAITAINSHLVRGIAEDCARLEPDLFIVYEGHNEVIGPFGPAGVFTGFLRNESALRFALWLKGTRTGQLLSSLTRRELPARWGGMEMFLRQQIAADDPRLDAVRAHFRANLLAITAAAHRAGATTLVCTTLAAQHDFAPFLSLHRSDLTTEQLAQWENDYARANEAASLGHLGRAEAAYRAALEIDDRHAELTFRLARFISRQGNFTAAQPLFQRALDLDALRFRADSSLNQVIRDLPAHVSVPSDALRIVDLHAPAAGLSRFLPGNNVLYEHVHLTFQGTYLVAEELLRPIARELAARGLVPHAAPTLLSAEDARARLAFTTYEQALIYLELQNRFQRPPFTAQSDHAQRLATTARRIASAQSMLARDDALASLRATYEQALTHSPGDWILYRNAGMMLLARGAPADALPCLQRALDWIPDDAETLIALARTHGALGHSTEARLLFTKARHLEPAHPAFRVP